MPTPRTPFPTDSWFTGAQLPRGRQGPEEQIGHRPLTRSRSIENTMSLFQHTLSQLGSFFLSPVTYRRDEARLC